MKNTLILSVITLILSGCNNPDNNTLNSSSEIVFNVKNVKNTNTRAGYDTPSDITSADPGFGIYIVNDPADLVSSGNRADNHNIKWNGSTWFNATTHASGTKLEWPESGTVSAFAYCPLQTEITDITNIPISIQSDQTTLENMKASDFLRAQAFNCQKNENGTIPLTFYHKLSKLKFNITCQPEVGTLTSLEVSADLFNQGTYNLLTGKVTTNLMYTSNPQAYIYNKTSTSATAEVILMPQEINKGKFLKITTEKLGKDVYYILNLPENLILDGSTQYIFNITLKPSVEESDITLNPSILSIKKWDEVEKGDWKVEGFVKDTNILKASFGSDVMGLNLVITPSLPLSKGGRVSIYIDEIPYSEIRAGDSIAICPNLKGYGLVGKRCKLSIAAVVNNGDVDNGIMTEDEYMSYKIEPEEIDIPASIGITPIYDKAAGTIVFTTSQNVEADITCKVYQVELQNSTTIETVSVDAVIPRGTNKSQIIDVKAWDKNANALVTLKTQSTDTRFPWCCFIRENVYYTLTGGNWSSLGTNYTLHIIL